MHVLNEDGTIEANVSQSYGIAQFLQQDQKLKRESEHAGTNNKWAV
jgi:hypothetical protein